MLDAHSTRIMKRTSECRIKNVCGSGIMHMEGVLLAAYVGCKSCFNRRMDLNKGTVYLSSELFPFFCMYIVLPFSPFLLYIRPSSIINSPRFHAYCYLPSFCLSHASPGSHFFFFTPLFWFLCAMCTTFSSIFNFPHTRSVDHNCLERGCTA